MVFGISPLRDSEVRAYCGKRIVLGPDVKVAVASFFLVTVPSLLLSFYTAIHLAVTLCSMCFMASSLFFLWRTATTDPGFLPKQPPPTDPPGLIPCRNRFEDVTIPISRGAAKTIKVERKWCYTCNILRPPRASHCQYCNACVERLDHHCPWTGTCVGRRNYRYFLGFIFSTTLLSLCCIASCVAGLIIRKEEQDKNAMPVAGDPFWNGAKETSYIEFILLLYAVVFLLMVGGLSCYHIFLVVNNMTTHEEMKSKSSATFESLYDVGCCGNIRDACCYSTDRSQLFHAESASAEMQETPSMSLNPQRGPDPCNTI